MQCGLGLDVEPKIKNKRLHESNECTKVSRENRRAYCCERLSPCDYVGEVLEVETEAVYSMGASMPIKQGWVRLWSITGVFAVFAVGGCGGQSAGTDSPVNAVASPLPANITIQNTVNIANATFHALDTVVMGSLAPLFMMNATTGLCTFGGRLDVTVHNNDADPSFTPGDVITFVATQCGTRNPDQSKIAPMTTNGGLVITGLAQKNDPVTGTREESWRVNYERYTIDNGIRVQTLDGVTSLSTANTLQTATVLVRTTEFSFTEGNEKFEVPSLLVEVSTDKIRDITTERYLGMVPTRLGNVEVDTIDPLVSGRDANPSSGQIEIFTENSGFVMLPRDDGVTVDVQVDANGDGSPEETLIETWASLGW